MNHQTNLWSLIIYLRQVPVSIKIYLSKMIWLNRQRFSIKVNWKKLNNTLTNSFKILSSSASMRTVLPFQIILRTWKARFCKDRAYVKGCQKCRRIKFYWSHSWRLVNLCPNKCRVLENDYWDWVIRLFSCSSIRRWRRVWFPQVMKHKGSEVSI